MVINKGYHRQIIAPLERTDVHNAHAETLSVSVLVEDAILDCESTIGIRRQNAGKWISLSPINSFIYSFVTFCRMMKQVFKYEQKTDDLVIFYSIRS